MKKKSTVKTRDVKSKKLSQSVKIRPVFSSKAITPPGKGTYPLPGKDGMVFQTKDAKTIDGYDNFLSRIGLNNDNALSGGLYEFNLMTRNRIQLEAAYRGSWVVGAVVDSVAEDMTRAGVDITTNEADEDIKDIQSAFSRLQIWQSLCDLEKWARLYGGALGVLQIEGQALDSPLNLDTISEGQFKGIVVYDRWQLNPVLQNVIQSGPEMGLPKFYQIVNNPAQLEPSAPNTSTGELTVHHSRVIRDIGIKLPYFQAITEMMWGESILERLWDRLISFDNATMSSASLIDRANLRTVGVDGLREILGAGGKAQQALEKMFEMMRLLQVNEGLTIIDKEDSFASTAYSFAGLSDMMLQFGQQLSGASGIPLVRLFGQSPAGLSATGDSDIRMYYDNINAAQESKFRRPLDLVIRVLWRSVFGKAAPKDLEFSFTPLWQMSAKDKSDIAKSNAETVIGANEHGLVKKSTALKELRQASGDTGLFSNVSDEEISEAEEDEENPPEPELGQPGSTDVPPEENKGPPVPSLDHAITVLDSRSTHQRIKDWLAK